VDRRYFSQESMRRLSMPSLLTPEEHRRLTAPLYLEPIH